MPLADSRITLPERYRVVRHVANGGMASVWAVEDAVLGRLVAVKVMSGHVAADPSARRRFEREARTAARVSDHPNVATIYDVGEHEDVPFIVMELFTGGSVADRLRTSGTLPRSRSIDWLEQAAGALDYAHGEGIVHRDVKPANLLLDERDRLAVGDFGIARAADDTNLTQVGQVLGTAAYLSPEQAMGEPATAASDRYSLGVVAFELLTGRRPFQGEHAAAQARQHVEGEIPSTRLGPDIDAVLARAMAKHPDDRYPTAARFVDELRAVTIRAGGPVTAPTRRATSVAEPAPRAADSPPASRRLQPVGAAAAGGGDEPARSTRRGDGNRRGWLALAALGALAVAAVLVALVAGGGDDAQQAERPAQTAERRQSREQPAQTQEQEAPSAAAPAPEPQKPTDTTGSSDTEQQGGAGPDATGETPEALAAAGFERLQSGDAAGALPLLERADRGFASQGDSADSLQWGYALFNLGTAYMEAGRPADAVGAFERRLEVSPNDQRDKVEQALADARAAAGQDGAPKKKAKKAKD